MKALLPLALSLLLSVLSVQAQLSVTWNGANITGPVLIYQNEILVDASATVIGDPDAMGALTCRSEDRAQVAWHFTNAFRSTVLSSTNTNNRGTYYQIRTGTGVAPSVSQLFGTSANIALTGAILNGLWLCRLNGGATNGQHASDGEVPVGIYNNVPGNGEIAANIAVSLSSSSSFLADPPTFTLVSDTSGGPPETNFWTRDGEMISDGISIAVNLAGATGGAATTVYEQSRYRSTLTVTGILPGVYQYSVTNRATSGDVIGSITIQGAEPPTNLMAMQTGLGSVMVSWTAPSPPPSGGYRITVDSSAPATVSSSPHTITIPLGMHSIQVTSISQHLPSEPVGPVEVTVRGTLAPVITTPSPTATSVTISWTLPPFSLPLDEYRVSLTRGTVGDQLCPTVPDTRPAVTTTATSMEFTGLQEFSIYTVRVSAVYTAFGLTSATPAEIAFTTLSAVPSQAPSSVMDPSMITSTGVTVSWSTIECIHRNGLITTYEVELRDVGGTLFPGQVVGQTFTASGLRPFTNYTFKVAGVNSEGTGPFTDPITFRTDEDVPGVVSDFMGQPKFTSVVLTWSSPQRPNGIIVVYEVTYRVSGDNLVTTNTTDNRTTTFTIPSLTTETTVSSISVSAYTSVGRGQAVQHPDLTTLTQPPVVMNIRVQKLTENSVNVSWDKVNIPEITSYIVYYGLAGSRKRQGEQSVMIPSSDNSAEIGGLGSSVEYKFQVVAVAELDGDTIMGERSEVDERSRIRLSSPSTGPPVGAVIGGVVLAVAVVVAVIIAVIIIILVLRRRRTGTHKPVGGVHYAKANAPLVNIKQNFEPTIDDFPEDTHATEGESVVFKVVVSGKPEPSLTWYHDDTEVVTDYAQEVLDDGSLSIPSVEPKQAGVYRLAAVNSSGRVELEVKLSVQMEVGEKTPDTDRRVMTFAPLSLESFGEYVSQNHANNNQGFRDQFQGLESGDEYPKTVGLSVEFKKLNRFANITNYDHSHIDLTPIEGQPECEREFINGCYIEGYSAPKRFIATQGPIPRSIVDFWRLVWQERPPTIVMVTNLKEGNKKKCEQYWPDSGSTTFGPFKVTLTENQLFADYCIRTMQVSLQGSNRPHKLQQYHFTAWPDHGVPDYATPMLAFHRRIVSSHNPKRGPILVHCSAGVGRTGTFMCIDIVLQQIKKEKVVDIAGVINRMRHQRMKMVQTADQYFFLHDAILESVTCGDTQITAADLRMKIRKYERTDPATGLNTFQSQFNVLEQVSPKVSEVICKSAKENPDKNRNHDYLPPDRFRVILKGETPDYIHAVFAHGYKHQKTYIIAEGPMVTTARNMLKILYDRKCGAIAMLSSLVEDGLESTCQYWPSAVGQLVTFGEYVVDMISEEALEGFTIRTLSVLEQKTQKAHQVTQFHITCWRPDGQCSNLKGVVDAIDEIAKVQRRSGNKPIFVHCNDTVTRSGMFCSMATMIDRCKTEGVVDVFQVVKALRVQKPGAVPTMETYKIIFEATLTFLDSFDTYANFQNV